MTSIKIRCSLLVLTFLLVPLKHLEAQNDASGEIESKIDAIFKNFDDLNAPGATVAVVQDQKIIFKKGYGSANLEYGIPNSPSTIFHIASVSKQFTVFAILLLEKEGKLSFDDDIRTYIPEVPDFGKTITLKHLASHTSGMRDQWTLLGLAGWRFDDVITKEHILKIVAQQKELNFDPGEEYTYCNTGFTLLAEVVARVSGKSFAEFTEERIFKPLKMSNTLFYDDHEKIVKNRAYSYYYVNNNTFKKSVLSFANVGATSLFTTVEDLALWSMNFSLNTVGDKAIIEKMNTLAVLNNGETFGGAYGQFVNTHRGLNQIQHGGADAGYRSYLGRFPDQNFAVMVFSNLAQSNPGNLALQVADIYLEDFIEKDTSTSDTTTPDDVDYIKLSSKELEKFNGHFWNEDQKYARKIYVKNDTLRYFRGEGNESALAPVSPTEFKMLGINVDLRVKFSELNKKRKMTVIINDDEPIISYGFTPPSYEISDLKEFTGAYYSPELQTTYNAVIKNGKLTFTHHRASDTSVSSAKHDMFLAGGYSFMFERNANKQITGFRVSAGRVRNLWFKKVN
ncbi:serine hydrolase domain-containing protein [uncultured Psychroserpens sp.]|uniref:serine hydrolase domain-containing protein n=1 Tax=uncultured Psychroserpens sp. TaxID=255436 RepID=UPI00262535A4|nr:serine hydrolase domain-containing protein [uncultured Psychroserpens sp.]